MEKFLDTPVKRYSSGMMVRLAFAVAAHLDPEILIVDEVLAVGDAEFQKKCLGKMESVAKGGRTVLFVSHNMAAVANLCNKGIVLNKGKVVFLGTVHRALDFYSNSLAKETPLGVARRPDYSLNYFIESVKIVDDKFHIKSTFKYCEPLGIIATLNGVDFKFCFSFLIKNQFGQCIYHLRSQDYGHFFLPTSQKKYYLFVCALPSLTEGTFFYNCMARRC